MAPENSLTPADEAFLRAALKRCSASTYEAACRFRHTGNIEHLPAIVHGIVARYVEPDLRAKLEPPDDGLRLIDDLGIDSLTLMQIVLLVEDVLRVSINNEELCPLRTLGDVQRLIAGVVPSSPAQPPIEQLGSLGHSQFPAPWVPVRSPAEYQLLVGRSLCPKRLASESRGRSS
jgi:3-hydroxyacyl-[acyl-carrier-protein] dehydratase